MYSIDVEVVVVDNR